MSNFYCQRLSGNVNFSIDDWNERFKKAIKEGKEMPVEDGQFEIGCTEQCFECMTIVKDRQIKTIQLLNK